MKAVILDEHGSADGFRLSEIPKPTVLSGHVVLKVCASSVNPVDCKIRNGILAGISPDFLKIFAEILFSLISADIDVDSLIIIKTFG